MRYIFNNERTEKGEYEKERNGLKKQLSARIPCRGNTPENQKQILLFIFVFLSHTVIYIIA